MLITTIIILGSLLAVVSVGVLIVQLIRAPEGSEDEAGFHYVKSKRTVPSRYYFAKSVERREVKAFKAHSPAA